jgi:hypothetical protein
MVLLILCSMTQEERAGPNERSLSPIPGQQTVEHKGSGLPTTGKGTKACMVNFSVVKTIEKAKN